jgi:single-stranded DNA-binding protein
MLSITANGYVTGEIKVQDGEYGRSATLGIRCKTGNGKQTHYVNAVFYGKKIELAQRFLEDGRQVTVVGSIKSVLPKKKKDGTDFVAMYVDVQEFSLPEMKSSEEGYSDAARSRKAVAEIDEVPF